jgi:hypothetical protein
MLRPFQGSGSEKTQSGYALGAFFLHHIFAATETASQFLLSGTKKRHIQPER